MTPRALLVGSLTPAALALAGCAGQATSPPVAPPTPPVPTPAVSTPAVSTPAGEPTGPTPPATPSTTPRTDPSMTPVAVATASPSTASGAPAGGGTVEASAYRTAQGYYFTSPTGNIMCAISTVPAMADRVVGCQAKVTVANLPRCRTPDSLAPAAWIPADRSKPVTKDCVNQGFFVGDGAKVLPYGSVLAVNGYRCESAASGVSCRVEGGQRGFTFAREGVQTTS